MAAAVTAAVAYIAANAGAVAMATIAIASAAYSYSMSRKAKKMANEDSTSERKQIVRSSSLPENHIFGKRRSSGLLFFANEEAGEQDDGEWIHMAITHAGHNLSYIGELLINEEDPNNYAGFYEEEHFLSGLNVADNFLLSNCPDWKENMIGKGFSWGRISLKFDQEKYPTGLPNVNWLKHGYAVYDPRDGLTKFTENSALCILHALRNIWGWEDEFLIMDTFIDAANICDEFVNDPDGGLERRYIMSAEFDDTDTPASVLEKMLATCAGEWIRVGGRLGLRVGAYYGPAFIEITEDDLIGPIDIQPEPERKDAFNIVRGSYVAPDQNYETVDYPEVRVDEWVAEDGEEVVLDLDLTYVPSPYQAQRLADLTLMRSRYGMTITLPCNLRGFKATPGTMIKLSLPTIGFDDEFIVVDWDFSVKDGVNLVVRRDLANFYDDAVGKPITTPPLISLPSGGIAAPSNPQFTAQQVGDVVQGVITWQNPEFKTAHTNVIIKDNAGFIVQSAQVPFPSSELPINGRLAGNYSVELFSVGVNGAKSAVTEMSFVVAAPSTPDEISIRTSNWAIYLIPVYSAGTTPYGTLFEFYLDTTESTEPPPENRQPDEIASSWTTGGLTPDTNYYYWIRAVNSYGKSGWVQKTVKTTKEQDLVTTVVERLEAIEIVSRDFVEWVSGYKLWPDGKAEFNDIYARGDIYAKSLTFSDSDAIPDEINNSNVASVTTYSQSTEPAGNIETGSLWYDTDSNNKPYRYDGEGWVAIQDGDIAAAQSTANTSINRLNGLYPNQSTIQIKSGNYISGSRGWAIDNGGNAEFNNGIFRGTLYAGDIQGNITSGKGAYVNAVNINSSGWTTVATISWKASSAGIARNVIVLPIEIYGLGRILVNGTQRIITEPVFGRIGASYGVTVYVGSGSGSIQVQLKKWTQGGSSAPSSIYNQYLNALLVPASSDFN
ncbi:MAG: phage tail tip protein J-related protein [Vibrio litoralis]|uniref:phage tail tip protein J-related protein n=1 Tax=Vibrio litoralis TaxID=335972 RepID=UPI003F9C8E9E